MHFANERGARLSSILPSPSGPGPSFLSKLAFRLTALAGLIASLAAVYAFWVRTSQLHWGATPAEIARPMPEDGVVPHPAFDATRAITIHARPGQIWPWLVQIGYGRAGFYGYDLIENPGGGSGIRSAQKILPQFQNPQPGDSLPLSVAATLVYGPIEPGHCIVWLATDHPPSGAFVWELVPIDDSHTRLISRIRWQYLHTPLMFALGVFTEFADHVAVRAILRGVRDRAEGRPTGSLIAQAFEIGAWLLAGFEIILGAVWVISWQHWKRAWLLAAGAGLLLQLLLYAGLPVWLNAALPWIYLALMMRFRQAGKRTHRATATLTEIRPHEPAAAS
jgi:hypothetical protein